MITKEEKAALVKEFGENDQDTGNPAVQVAILSTKVKILTEHLKTFKKDNHSRRGMRLMLGKRGSLLKYLKKKDVEGYRTLIAKLNIKDKY